MEGWKNVLKYLLEYKRITITLSLAGVAAAITNGAVPFITGRFYDAIFITQTVSLLGISLSLWVYFLLIWLFLQLVSNFSDYYIDREGRKITTKIHVDYIAKATAHLLSLPISFHKEEKTGEIWHRITRASGALDNILGSVVLGTAPQFLSIVVGFIFAFSINIWLAAIILAGFLLYSIVLARTISGSADKQKIGQEKWGEMMSAAHDTVGNFQTVKQATAEEYESKNIKDKFAKPAFQYWFEMEKIWANIGWYHRIIVMMTTFTVFIIAVLMIRAGNLSIGSLLALMGYAAMVFGPMVRLGFQWQNIQNGVIAINRAEKILALPGENIDAENKIKPMDISGNVVFDHVHFSYRPTDPEVLQEVDFSVKQGEIVALVGESGVGKTTVIDLISGYYFPSHGRILIDGYDTRELDLSALRRHIAVVPQETVLFNDTIEMNIKYSKPDAKREEIEEAARLARADAFIENFPNKDKQLVGERGIKLSVGQKQRIAIARAILRDPKILILDEPTSALDPQTEKFITESLEKLMRGRTTFIIAHRLSTVRKADRIIVFEKGTVVEIGTHEKLLKKKGGVYARLYKLHVGLS